MGKVRLKEIARLSGVSISTVSRVVNEPDHVNSETREAVYGVMRELGYKPGYKASVSDKKGVLGVVTPQMYSEFAMDLILALEEEISPHGIYPLLINSGEERSLSVLLNRDSRWAGLVDMAVLVNMDVDERAFHYLQERNIHCAVVHSRCPYCFSVLNNNYLGGFDAAEYLWKKGYRRPGIIMWNNENNNIQEDRRTGFLKALEGRGVRADQIPQEYSRISPAGGSACTERILRDHDLDALFFTSDTMAIGGLEYCRKQKIRIPEDIAVMGFDDIRMASTMNLTTMKQFIPAKAKTVVDHLIQCRDAVLPPEYPGEVTMTPVLVERQTT
ncbi:LacI family DNA-binding transcriptional regulator [Oceanispirochaeta sp.]|uniref:LacI family DNA-binding transcriptional regulator n=1 Tax=Oceanispirochaeta sp. TaxID=2035350 RepID=UPI00262F991B|nr:LacI family DNA-binding transcriptional regulator [Oceanispirochaeta sp.]MDA3957615.1 LacI family DNA-binding transcriptional regulator [Oceanispirochaeta sp.]